MIERKILLFVVLGAAACSAGDPPQDEHAFATDLGYHVSVKLWQKDAYRDVPSITPGWPQHTTSGVYVTDLATGATTLRCENDNHGSSIASGLVQETTTQVCPSTYATREQAEAFADALCSCTCDVMAAGATSFLGQDNAADLLELKTYLEKVEHAALNARLHCGPEAGEDPTQRLVDALRAQPPEYAAARTMLASQCAPSWTEIPPLLFGSAWGSYHVCNNDAALELDACGAGACPSWPADAATIGEACRGPRIMRP